MIMATLPRQLLFLLLLVISVKISISADCYYMNREKTTELTRCSNDANPKIESTLCCMPGDRCMVNSLCLREKKDGDKHYYRGGCTIKDWKGKSLYDCPPILCKPARVAGMYPCNTSNPDTGFVCQEAFPDGPPDHCDSSVTFDGGLEDFLGTASPLPSPSTSVKDSTSASKPSETEDKGDPVKTSQDTADTSLAHTATRPAPDTSDVPVTTTVAEPTGTSNISVSTASGESTASVESTAAPPPPSSEEPQQDNSAVPVGVGIGVGLAVTIAGGFLVFFYIRKRQREAPIRAETPPPLDPSIQKPDNNYYPFAPYPSATHQGSLSSRNDDYFRQPKIPNVMETAAAAQQDNVYPGQPRYQPPKRTFSHELP
ncbi:Putative protein of unknown function [Podospora comata]|uniref:Uncharacterized protein n=1 Tax=Podospora comata TaxID=48703 RepID=A0ABY6S8B8_PODCO|nr:Putative protein of unknown function [Podospora comata]